MVVCLLPAVTSAAAATSATLFNGTDQITLDAATPYWVNGAATAVADAPTGGYNAYFAAGTHTLYLNSAVIASGSPLNTMGLSVSGDLIIDLTGTSTVTGAQNGTLSYGIRVTGNLLVQGGGTLNAIGGTASAVSCGVDVTGELGSNAEVSGRAPTLNGTGGTVTDAGSMCYGVSANSIRIENSGMVLTGRGGAADDTSIGVYSQTTLNLRPASVTGIGAAANYSYGVYTGGNMTVMGSSTVSATGGTAVEVSCGVCCGSNVVVEDAGSVINCEGGPATGADSNSYGLTTAYNITVTRGAIEGTGVAANSSTGVTAVMGSITVSGGSIVGEGGTAAEESIGVCSANGFSVSDGSITGTGGTASGAYCTSVGIDNGDGDITVSGGSVFGKGGTASGAACVSSGIYAPIAPPAVTAPRAANGESGNAAVVPLAPVSYADITVSGSGSITGEGGTANGERGVSSGIYTTGYDITVSGGSLTGTAGGATGDQGGSFGVHAPGVVSISGGTFIGTGSAVSASGESFGVYAVSNNDIAVTSGSFMAKSTSSAGTARALSVTATGTLFASESSSGSNLTEYLTANNDDYMYVSTSSITPPPPIPETGDSSLTAVWVSMALVSIMGLAIVILKKRTTENR